MDATVADSQQMRPGWRLLLYLALVFVIGTGSMVLFEALSQRSHVGSLGGLLLHEIWGFAIVFGSALVMAQLEHRSPGAYGLPLRAPFLKRFAQGAVIGAAEISALIALIALFGGYSFGSLALHGLEALQWGSLWLAIFVVVGLFEEFTFRGYTQFTLGEGLGFWPAAIILSLAFGAVHLRNAGENWAGASGVFLIGIIFAFSLKRTGSLWLAVGMHTGFDFGETFLYSVPNSGVQFQGHLSNAQLLGGKIWLTGGSVGPEASAFGFLTMALVALMIHFCFPARGEKANLGSASVHQL